ncbi:hypothetical protein RND71_022310 [Anisodus tanguticus]|uniref:Uncharacterized protein n=1 Tax=Anisodus tanguticus TaxID=243964 RepID=A0AAE1S065_9SOLA|nr:hypothetical protein RND71_022310 [Anisodus tanguticus]
MPITSMSPLFLFPLFGISSADDVAHSYMDDVIALVLGSFILALAVEHYNIHRRLALNVNNTIILWGPNESTASPLRDLRHHIFCQHVAAQRGSYCDDDAGSHRGYILCINWRNEYFDWDRCQLDIGWDVEELFSSRKAFKKGSSRSLSAYLDKAHLKRELDILGPISFAEKMILTVFSILIVLWMTRSITEDIPGWGSLFGGRAGDGTVSVMMATLLFIIPSKKQPGEKLMDWNKCKKLPWNIILLLGAGFAIADGVRSSGLADVLSRALDFLENAPYLAIAPAVCLISGTLTEFITSNNATATIMVPLLIEIAKNMRIHPLLLMIPGAIGAQFAFLLPTATPSNVVGFTTGHIDIRDMIQTGLPLKVAGIVALSLLMPTLGPIVFGTDKPVKNVSRNYLHWCG